MARPDRIEGLAIVSVDDMIADAAGVQPAALRIEADHRFFHDRLEQATAVAHGRFSGEGGAGAAHRLRLILTHRVAALARDPQNHKAVLWNPAGARLSDAWAMLGLDGGVLAVIGGTEVFGLFLELGYDAFHLSRAGQAKLPGGRPVFPGIPPRTAEELLSRAGLKPSPVRVLDPLSELTLVRWER